MPPLGEGRVLTEPQLRWCEFEKARIEAMKEFMSSDEETGASNTYESRYNRHCANTKYSGKLLALIDREFLAEGKRLQAEGVERILSVRAATNSTSHPIGQEDKGLSKKNEGAEQAAISPPKLKSADSPQESSMIDLAIDLEIVRSEFGLFGKSESGRLVFQSSNTIPLKEGQGYGWFIELRTTKPSIKWREEFILPAAPETLGVAGSTARHSISVDRKTITTEREVTPQSGLISNVWTVAAGDPKGRHLIRVYVEGRLARSFEFQTE